jgi:hypothetical protein
MYMLCTGSLALCDLIPAGSRGLALWVPRPAYIGTPFSVSLRLCADQVAVLW